MLGGGRGEHRHTSVAVRGQFAVSVPSFHYGGCQDQIQIQIGQVLDPLSHLAGPLSFIVKYKHCYIYIKT